MKFETMKHLDERQIVGMSDPLAIIGSPSSAGAYAPGQEKAPKAFRAAGLLEHLSARGITVDDRGDVPGFRWRVDRTYPRAMNADMVAAAAKATAGRVADALSDGAAVLPDADSAVIRLRL